MLTRLNGRVLGHKGLNRPHTRSLVVQFSGIDDRSRAQRLVGKVASVWDHLGLPIRGKVTGVRDDSGRVTVTMSRNPIDHPVRRVELVL